MLQQKMKDSPSLQDVLSLLLIFIESKYTAVMACALILMSRNDLTDGSSHCGDVQEIDACVPRF